MHAYMGRRCHSHTAHGHCADGVERSRRSSRRLSPSGAAFNKNMHGHHDEPQSTLCTLPLPASCLLLVAAAFTSQVLLDLDFVWAGDQEMSFVVKPVPRVVGACCACCACWLHAC